MTRLVVFIIFLVLLKLLNLYRSESTGKVVYVRTDLEGIPVVRDCLSVANELDA